MTGVALIIIIPMLFLDSVFDGTIFEKQEKPPEEPGELCALMYGKVMSLHQAARRATKAGEQRFALNNYYKALMVLKNIRAVKPDWNAATVDSKIEHYDRLVEQLETSIEEQERVYKKERARLQGNIEKNPNKPRPHVEMADFHFNHGKVSSAEKELKRAIDLESEDAETRIKLGNSYEAQGDYERAIAEYRTAIRMDPSSAQGHYNLGAAYFATSKLKTGASTARRASQANPQAVVALKRAIEFDPEHVDAYISLGMVYNRQKQHKFALAAFKKALMLEPDNPVVNYNIGSTYCSLLNFVNATNYMNRAATQVGRDTPMGKSIRKQITELRRYNLKGQEGRGYRDRSRMLIYKGRSVSGPKFRRWRRRRDRWAKDYKQQYL
ncbi:MAG: tetratricopeptide repeat protein [Candidatus Tritonobacter lacicola]|nr:tetratricopeptide repeat protein [Candidatus Tritonobacter lacicola]